MSRTMKCFADFLPQFLTFGTLVRPGRNNHFLEVRFVVRPATVAGWTASDFQPLKFVRGCGRIDAGGKDVFAFIHSGNRAAVSARLVFVSSVLRHGSCDSRNTPPTIPPWQRNVLDT